MSETTAVRERPTPESDGHRPNLPPGRLVKLVRRARPARGAVRAAALRRGVLAPHRLRGLRRDHRRSRAQPARRHHRPAVAGPRLLPGCRCRHLHLHLGRAGRHRQPVRRSGLVAASRHGPRRRRRRSRRAALQPDRGPPARDLPRHRLARARLHRRPRAQHVGLGDRRLQRSSGAVLLALRLQLRRQRVAVPHRPRCPLRTGRAALVSRPGALHRRLLVRRQPDPLATRSCAAGPARQRGGGLGDGCRRP